MYRLGSKKFFDFSRFSMNKIIKIPWLFTTIYMRTAENAKFFYLFHCEWQEHKNMFFSDFRYLSFKTLKLLIETYSPVHYSESDLKHRIPVHIKTRFSCKDSADVFPEFKSWWWCAVKREQDDMYETKHELFARKRGWFQCLLLSMLIKVFPWVKNLNSLTIM